MDTLWLVLRASVYGTLFLAAWGWAALTCRAMDKHIPLRLPGWTVVPGAALFLLGAILALTTVVSFILEGRGTPALFDPPRRLVARGPYLRVRNPMYIGGVLTLLGWSLYLRSPSMALFALGAFPLIHFFVVFVEEPGLRRRFGSEYEKYCKTVPRWIPRFSQPHHSR